MAVQPQTPGERSVMPSHNPVLTLPQINLQRCVGCGRCVERCPVGAVAMRDGHPIFIAPERCSFCERCERYCPEGAIGRPFRIVFATKPER